MGFQPANGSSWIIYRSWSTSSTGTSENSIAWKISGGTLLRLIGNQRLPANRRERRADRIELARSPQQIATTSPDRRRSLNSGGVTAFPITLILSLTEKM